MSRADMRAVKIDQCRLCIVLSAKVPTRDEPVLADKEVLLTALNIKALRCATLLYLVTGLGKWSSSRAPWLG